MDWVHPDFLGLGWVAKIFNAFLLREADEHGAFLLRQRGWLTGWLSVTRQYCV